MQRGMEACHQECTSKSQGASSRLCARKPTDGAFLLQELASSSSFCLISSGMLDLLCPTRVQVRLARWSPLLKTRAEKGSAKASRDAKPVATGSWMSCRGIALIRGLLDLLYRLSGRREDLTAATPGVRLMKHTLDEQSEGALHVRGTSWSLTIHHERLEMD